MFHTLHPNLILGYHGCDEAVGEAILAGEKFKPSNNDYDWLGPGIYFWESNPTRALSFAQEQMGRGRVKKPIVVGAVLTLGKCLDTLNEECLQGLESAYQIMKDAFDANGVDLPQNSPDTDKLRRPLDCAVITVAHAILDHEGTKLDSVRGLYHEGGPLFDNSGFHKKSHVQIAICNDDCIKGVFRVKM